MLKEKDTFIKTLQADHIESIQRHNARIKELQARYDRHCEKQERYITDLVQEQASLENDLVNLRDKCHRLESVAPCTRRRPQSNGKRRQCPKGGSPGPK
jgi:chromosome segregation ATPase